MGSRIVREFWASACENARRSIVYGMNPAWQSFGQSASAGPVNEPPTVSLKFLKGVAENIREW